MNQLEMLFAGAATLPEQVVDEQMLLHDLAPDPRDEWQRMLRFAAFGQADKDAMA
ncbi:MAG: hypothetical protein GXO36_00755, partial [Chloroflexi bacterium]|nr:hypothetical protein [Chloroflexota bacterium]